MRLGSISILAVMSEGQCPLLSCQRGLGARGGSFRVSAWRLSCGYAVVRPCPVLCQPKYFCLSECQPLAGNGLRLGAGVYELFRTFKMHRAASTIGDAKIRKCRSAAKNVTPKATKDKQALLP